MLAVRDPRHLPAGAPRAGPGPRPQRVRDRAQRPGRGRVAEPVAPPQHRQDQRAPPARDRRGDRLRGRPRPRQGADQAPQVAHAQPEDPADDRHALGGPGEDRLVVQRRRRRAGRALRLPPLPRLRDHAGRRVAAVRLGRRLRRRVRQGVRGRRALRGRTQRHHRLYDRQAQRLRQLRRAGLPRPHERAREGLGRWLDDRRRAAARGRQPLLAVRRGGPQGLPRGHRRLISGAEHLSLVECERSNPSKISTSVLFANGDSLDVC